MAQIETARVAYASKPAKHQHNATVYWEKNWPAFEYHWPDPEKKTIVRNHTKDSIFISVYHQVSVKSLFRHMRRQLTLIPAYNHNLCFLTIEKETIVNWPAVNRVKIRIDTFQAKWDVRDVIRSIKLKIISVTAYTWYWDDQTTLQRSLMKSMAEQVRNPTIPHQH
jgi:hypothetical protein